MPARRPWTTRHELEPQTGLQRCRRRSPSAAGSLVRDEARGPRPQVARLESSASSTAASQPARASRASATGRRLPSNSPNAFIRPQRARRNRQIPIDPEPAIFIPRVRSLEAFGRRPRCIWLRALGVSHAGIGPVKAQQLDLVLCRPGQEAPCGWGSPRRAACRTRTSSGDSRK